MRSSPPSNSCADRTTRGGQHADQLGAVGGGGVDVVGRVELRERGLAEARSSATPERSTTVGTSLTER